MNISLRELAIIISEAQIGTYRDFRLILQSLGIPLQPPFRDMPIQVPRCFSFLGPEKEARYRVFLQQFNLEETLLWYSENTISVWTCVDQNYPPQLLHLHHPPVCVYVRGDSTTVSWEISDLISVVGTRKPSSYGKACTDMFVTGLVQSGFQIVSGLAYGIDALSHTVAIKNNGKTIAVIAGGIDTIYPKRNEALGKSIISSYGVVLSEYPPKTEIQPWMFPERNRIIAALSKGVLVVEGALKSGSLITAELGNEIGRDIFIIPGSIFSELSAGPHSLLSDGANIVTEISDILKHYPKKCKNTKNATIVQVTKKEQIILDTLSSLLYTPEMLVDVVPLPPQQTVSLVTELELKGVIQRDEYGILHVTKQVSQSVSS